MDYNKANRRSYRRFLINTSNGQHSYANFLSTTEDVDSCINLFTMSKADGCQGPVPKKFLKINFLGFPNRLLNIIKIRNFNKRQESLS